MDTETPDLKSTVVVPSWLSVCEPSLPAAMAIDQWSTMPAAALGTSIVIVKVSVAPFSTVTF